MRIVAALLVIIGWLALTGCERKFPIVEYPFHDNHATQSRHGQRVASAAAPHPHGWWWCHEPEPAQRTGR